MSQYLGQIILFAGSFEPRGWAFCHGQLLPVASQTALFSLLGTMYGGDGKNTFALPDLRGRTPLGFGEAPGLTDRPLGARSGVERVHLLQTQIPPHTHQAMASGAASAESPKGALWAAATQANEPVSAYGSRPQVAMSYAAIQPAGGDQSHENQPPYLGLNYLISLVGIFPTRS